MTPQRIQLKFYVTNPDSAELDQFIDIFHGWIQEQKITDTLLVDVADYQHVPNGPGVILIGAQADYGIDEVGRIGLLYTRKREMADTFAASLQLALGQAITAARLIEAETAVRFAYDQIDVTVADKLAAPNTDEAFNQFSGDVVTVFGTVLGEGTTVSAERIDNDSRLQLQVRVVLSDDVTAETFQIPTTAVA